MTGPLRIHTSHLKTRNKKHPNSSENSVPPARNISIMKMAKSHRSFPHDDIHLFSPTLTSYSRSPLITLHTGASTLLLFSSKYKPFPPLLHTVPTTFIPPISPRIFTAGCTVLLIFTPFLTSRSKNTFTSSSLAPCFNIPIACPVIARYNDNCFPPFGSNRYTCVAIDDATPSSSAYFLVSANALSFLTRFLLNVLFLLA